MVEAWCEMAGIEIVPADMKHMRGVMKLVSKSFQSLPSNFTVRSIAEGRLFVALLDNLIVGFIEFEINHRDIWTISRMAVARPIRGHGVGTALLRIVTEEAHSTGKSVTVNLTEKHEALEFFIRNHFTTKEIYKNADGTKGFLMERPARW